MLLKRRNAREVTIGSIIIGGNRPIAIQSMTNTKTGDVNATVEQIARLTDAGCEIVRVAVPDMAAAAALREIKRRIHIPLIADVHFDHRLALAALESGADKLRLNPGNIGGRERVALVAKAAKERGVPIRVGVNSGSLEREVVARDGGVTAEGLAESALRHVKMLEEEGFFDIVIAIKASGVQATIGAYEIVGRETGYPLHIGITEAGGGLNGSIKSAAGLGALLSRGLGDTMRVSLTGDPVEEIHCAREILQAMELRSFGPQIVSCPTCGRTEVDLVPIARAVQERCKGMTKNMKISVMGCAVNGPGEAREADVGLAAGKGCGLIFRNGEIVRKVSEERLVEELMAEVEAFIAAGE